MRFLILLFVLLIFPINVDAEIEDNLSVEIFDIQAEKVIKIVHKTPAMQEEVESYVEQINGIYQGINPIPENGYMIKIPLNPLITIDNEWLQSKIDTVIIIIPEEESPYFLTFNEENLPRVFLFEGDIEPLLKELDFKP